MDDEKRKRVRKAGLEDVERMLFVINSTNELFFKDIIPPEHFRSPVLDEEGIIGLMDRMSFIVSELEGKVIGVAASAEVSRGMTEVHWVYVLPHCHRRGIGTGLMLSIEEEARRDDMTTVRLATPEEAIWAIRFYRKLGYVVTGKRPNPWGFDMVLEKHID